MITIYQAAGGDLDKIMCIVKRAGYDTKNERCIKELADNVGNWLEMYAPAFAKFSVKDELPVQAASLSGLQRAFLSSFSKIILQIPELSGEDYHNLVYSAKDQGSELTMEMARLLGIGPEQVQADPKELFKAVYIAVLGQQSGPKAGWFLSSLEKDFLVERFREAADYKP
jgi:lysyl-tRNA synthetase class 1